MSDHLYLVRVQCPACHEITAFVEEREDPVPLMHDVNVSAEYCPHCAVSVTSETEWDVHEEAYIVRTQDPTEDTL